MKYFTSQAYQVCLGAMKRNDGRQPNELRKIKLTPRIQKDPHGSVFIEWGRTHVICSATVEEKAPGWMQGQGLGWITAEYGMLPASSDKRISREKSRTNGRTHEIQRLIGRSLRAAVPPKILGERTILVDCDVLQADGGTRVASIVGGCLALRMALEKIKLTGPLNFEWVAAVSMGLVEGVVLTDLCYVEDFAASVDSNIVMLESGKFIELQATGEKTSFDMDEWQKILSDSTQACRQIIELQKRTWSEWTSTGKLRD